MNPSRPHPSGCRLELTPHFSLQELTHSDVAVRRGLDNAPNPGEVANLRRLCETVLEPTRWLLGVPLRVNSGFRAPAVNAAVGGKQNSAHLHGRACDFVPIGMDLGEAFLMIRQSSIPYDQVILEFNTWIHLAVSKAGVDPRRQALVLP